MVSTPSKNQFLDWENELDSTYIDDMGIIYHTQSSSLYEKNIRNFELSQTNYINQK